MANRILSLARLRENNPDEWRESVLTVCEWSTRNPDVKGFNGEVYHQATKITVGNHNRIKFWCDAHFNEASEFERYA